MAKSLSPLQQMAAAVASSGRVLPEDVVHTAAKLLRQCDEFEAEVANRELAKVAAESN